MSLNFINTGTGPNKGNGDTLRVAFTKINNNFQILSNLVSSVDFNNSLASIAFVAGPGIEVAHNTVTNIVNLAMLPATTSTLGGIVVGNNVAMSVDNKLRALINEVSDMPPLNPQLGDQWWDTTSGQGYIYYQDTWVESEPELAPPANSPLTLTTAPVSSTSTGTQGQLAYDGTYIYMCIASNSWKRVQWDAAW